MSELLSDRGSAGWMGRAGYLNLDPQPILCFTHEPDPSLHRRTSVLICSPFGWDDMASYRARRNWAQRLAQAGYPAVRFDLPSTGDSGGGPRDPGRLAAWVDATAQMIAWVRERPGTDRTAVFGIGLGGLLAWTAIADGAQVDDLLFWGVPASGRALVREQRAYAQVIAAGYAPEHQQTSFPEDHDEEVIGYLVTAETAGDLRALKPTQRRLDPPPERVLLLSRDELPVPSALTDYFAQSASEVHTESTQDFNALVATPQHALTPWGTIARSIAWLAQAERGDERRSPTADRAPGAAHARPVLPSVELEYEGRRVREEPVEIEVGGYRISGILTSPVDAAPADITAVLLSPGALRRIGLSRVWVELARRWAGSGISSLRFDQPGIGDSSGDERNLVSNDDLYDPRSTQIVLDVLNWLAGRGLPEGYVTVGSCSGAYWSLHAALADPRIAAALMITLYAFEWDHDLLAQRRMGLALSALQGRVWRRLLRRDLTIVEVRAKLRSISTHQLRGRLFAPAERDQSKIMENMLDTLRDHSTQALFIVSQGQAVLRQLAPDGQVTTLSRWPNVELERLPSPDNLFRALPLQAQIHAALDRALGRVIAADVKPNLSPADPGR
jgi:pimeloyl-ACP methyl ester carboxylesterase